MDTNYSAEIPHTINHEMGSLSVPIPRRMSSARRLSHDFAGSTSFLGSDMEIVANVQQLIRQVSSKPVMDEEDSNQALASPRVDTSKMVHILDWGMLVMVLVALIPISAMVVAYTLYPHSLGGGVLDVIKKSQFNSLVTFFFTITCTIVGVGLETLVGLQLVNSMSVTKELVLGWRFAQLLFPLFVTIALFSKSAFGLLFLPLGLWKLGFPEVVGSMLAAIILKDMPILDRTANFLDSLFLFVHHSCATYLICGVISGQFELSLELVSVTIPLIMEHWICLLKYHSAALYGSLEILLELWFELEAFRNAGLVPFEIKITAFVMLAAHWGLFLAGGLRLWSKLRPTSLTLAGHHIDSADIPNIQDPSQQPMDTHTPRLWKRTVSQIAENRRGSGKAYVGATWPTLPDL